MALRCSTWNINNPVLSPSTLVTFLGDRTHPGLAPHRPTRALRQRPPDVAEVFHVEHARGRRFLLRHGSQSTFSKRFVPRNNT